MRHVGITKALLRAVILRDGPASILSGEHAELTTEQAVAELDADPREIFVGCDCTKNDDGSCAGRDVATYAKEPVS